MNCILDIKAVTGQKLVCWMYGMDLLKLFLICGIIKHCLMAIKRSGGSLWKALRRQHVNNSNCLLTAFGETTMHQTFRQLAVQMLEAFRKFQWYYTSFILAWISPPPKNPLKMCAKSKGKGFTRTFLPWIHFIMGNGLYAGWLLRTATKRGAPNTNMKKTSWKKYLTH